MKKVVTLSDGALLDVSEVVYLSTIEPFNDIYPIAFEMVFHNGHRQRVRSIGPDDKWDQPFSNASVRELHDVISKSMLERNK